MVINDTRLVYLWDCWENQIESLMTLFYEELKEIGHNSGFEDTVIVMIDGSIDWLIDGGLPSQN